MSGKETIAAYLDEHALREQLEETLNATLAQRPEHVREWMAAYLARLPKRA